MAAHDAFSPYLLTREGNASPSAKKPKRTDYRAFPGPDCSYGSASDRAELAALSQNLYERSHELAQPAIAQQPTPAPEPPVAPATQSAEVHDELHLMQSSREAALEAELGEARKEIEAQQQHVQDLSTELQNEKERFSVSETALAIREAGLQQTVQELRAALAHSAAVCAALQVGPVARFKPVNTCTTATLLPSKQKHEISTC